MTIVNSSVFIKEGTPLGTLDWTFGTGTKKLEDWVSRVHPKYWRIHLLNGPCVRGGNCGRYEPVFGYSIASLDLAIRQRTPKIIKHVRERVKLYKELSAKFPDTTFLISPILEHNLSDSAWRVLADVVKNNWPEVRLVNNPMSPVGERYRGAIMEGHGFEARLDAEIVSLDGTDATDIDILEWMKNYRHVKIQYVWSRSYNCRNQGPWQDPRSRTSCPFTYQFEELAFITSIRGKVPALQTKECKKIVSFNAPWINKPMAEDFGTRDQRANKPVIITKYADKILQIIDYRGSEIGTMSLYGPFQNGLNRHYSAWNGGSYVNGYTLEKRAVEKSGYPYTWIKNGNECAGPLILGRRQGLMR